MTGNDKSKSHKGKSKNQSAQPAQTMNNGGQSINSQCNQGGWVEANYGAMGQNCGLPQIQGMTQQSYTTPYYNQNLNQNFQSGVMQTMQNPVMNMNMHNQGQGQGQVGQQTQSSTVHTDPVGGYSGSQQHITTNNNSVDNSTVVNMIQQLNNNFMGRLASIETSVSKLASIECDITLMRTDMTKLQLENAGMSRRMLEVEKSCQTISNMFEDAANSRSALKKEVSILKSENNKLRSDINDNVLKFEKRCSTLNSDLLELKARSMQSNLVFYGLMEAPQGTADNTESKLRDFLKHELELEEPDKVNDIVFDRVHRLGRPRRDQQVNPRPIVAKFERYKDREFIRQCSRDLNEKKNDYFIREQFPPEIRAKRKLLYPVMRTYARDPQNRVALVRDKLYINGQLYIPQESSGTSVESRGTQQDTDRDMQQDRDSYRDNRRRARGVRLAQLPPVELRNKYDPLSFVNGDDMGGSYASKPSKRPASSPAYDETLSKRYQGADENSMIHIRSSRVSDMQVGVSPISETIIQTDSVEPESSNDFQTMQVGSVLGEPVPSQSLTTDSVTVNEPLNVQRIQVDVHSTEDGSGLTGRGDNFSTNELEITGNSA